MDPSRLPAHLRDRIRLQWKSYNPLKLTKPLAQPLPRFAQNAPWEYERAYSPRVPG